jgi:anti-sigma regulatory factor (Ser/Thr protein kinase)
VTARHKVETFDRDAGDGPRARHVVTECLDAWGLGGEQQALELIVSELFTNAVLHGRGPIEVRMSTRGDTVRLEVHDRGGGHPALREPDPTGTRPGGWGLQLVDRLADAWGTTVDGEHTLVWVERHARDTAAAGSTGPFG